MLLSEMRPVFFLTSFGYAWAFNVGAGAELTKTLLGCLPVFFGGCVLSLLATVSCYTFRFLSVLFRDPVFLKICQTHKKRPCNNKRALNQGPFVRGLVSEGIYIYLCIYIYIYIYPSTLPGVKRVRFQR